MKYTIPKNVTKTLRVLLLIAFVCDLLMLPLVPALVLLNGMEPLEALAVSGMPDAPIWLLAIFLMAWITVWSYGGHAVMLTLFLLFSGVCAAVILWQGRRVLRTLLRGRPGPDRVHGLLERPWRRAGVLHRAVYPPVCHGGSAVSPHVRPVRSGHGHKGGERPDDLR